MKAMLKVLQADGEVRIMHSGRGAIIHRYSDGSLGVMLRPSGVIGPSQRMTLGGLRRLLAWLDDQPEGIL